MVEPNNTSFELIKHRNPESIHFVWDCLLSQIEEGKHIIFYIDVLASNISVGTQS